MKKNTTFIIGGIISKAMMQRPCELFCLERSSFVVFEITSMICWETGRWNIRYNLITNLTFWYYESVGWSVAIKTTLGTKQPTFTLKSSAIFRKPPINGALIRYPHAHDTGFCTHHGLYEARTVLVATATPIFSWWTRPCVKSIRICGDELSTYCQGFLFNNFWKS